MPEDKPIMSRPRRFFWVFLAIQAVPLIRLVVFPTWPAPTIWLVVLFANTTAFCLNLRRYLAGVNSELVRNARWMLVAAATLFGVATIIWGIQLILLVLREHSVAL
jgi:hypothetical protein